MTETRWQTGSLKVQYPNTPRLIGDRLRHMPRILAIDGGGVRGLSSLLILQRLMQEVQRLMEESGTTKGSSTPPLPCEYFDLICGTSTGGLIAIMLGRLRMVTAPSR